MVINYNYYLFFDVFLVPNKWLHFVNILTSIWEQVYSVFRAEVIKMLI